MRFVLLLIAAVIAVGAGVFALQYSGKPAPQPNAQPQIVQNSNVNTVDVLVAKEPVTIGTTLEEGMIDRQPWPAHLVLEGMITADGKDSNLVGKVARAPFAAREPYMTGKLANPNDPSFLAASLPEGMRAITIATDAISGVAGYVFPGDKVDVILLHNIPQEVQYSKKHEGMSRTTKPELSEVLISNVRVLAVNVRPAAGKENTGTTPTNVTVAVSETDAQKIRLAEKNGVLSLALRSIKDQPVAEEPNVIPVQSLTNADSIADQTTGDSVRIIRGAGKDSDAARAAAPMMSAEPAQEPTNEQPR